MNAESSCRIVFEIIRAELLPSADPGAVAPSPRAGVCNGTAASGAVTSAVVASKLGADLSCKDHLLSKDLLSSLQLRDIDAGRDLPGPIIAAIPLEGVHASVDRSLSERS